MSRHTNEKPRNPRDETPNQSMLALEHVQINGNETNNQEFEEQAARALVAFAQSEESNSKSRLSATGD